MKNVMKQWLKTIKISGLASALGSFALTTEAREVAAKAPARISERGFALNAPASHWTRVRTEGLVTLPGLNSRMTSALMASPLIRNEQAAFAFVLPRAAVLSAPMLTEEIAVTPRAASLLSNLNLREAVIKQGMAAGDVPKASQELNMLFGERKGPGSANSGSSASFQDGSSGAGNSSSNNGGFSGGNHSGNPDPSMGPEENRITKKTLPGIYRIEAREFVLIEARFLDKGALQYRYFRDDGVTRLYDGRWTLKGNEVTASMDPKDPGYGTGRLKINVNGLAVSDLKKGVDAELGIRDPEKNESTPLSWASVKVTKTDNPVFPPDAEGRHDKREQDYSHFLPRRIKMREGKTILDQTIVMEGEVNREVSAVIRSPILGQRLITEQFFGRAPEAERPIAYSELKGLSEAISRYLKDNPNGPDAGLYGKLLDQITADVLDGPRITDETIAKVSEAFRALQTNGFPGIRWQSKLPKGISFVTVNLGESGGRQYAAMIPTGALAPDRRWDPNKAEYFILSRSNGDWSEVSYSNPISLKASGKATTLGSVSTGPRDERAAFDEVVDAFLDGIRTGIKELASVMRTPRDLRDQLEGGVTLMDRVLLDERVSGDAPPAEKKAYRLSHEHLVPALERALKVKARSIREYAKSVEKALKAVDSVVKKAKTLEEAVESLDGLFLPASNGGSAPNKASLREDPPGNPDPESEHNKKGFAPPLPQRIGWSELLESSPLRRLAGETSSDWAYENSFLDGSQAHVFTGRLWMGVAPWSDELLKRKGHEFLKRQVADEQTKEEQKTGARISDLGVRVLPRKAAVPMAADKAGSVGFMNHGLSTRSKKNREILDDFRRQVRGQIRAVVSLLGDEKADMPVVLAQGRTLLANVGDEEKEVVLFLFVNRVTGEFAGFYFRDGSMPDDSR